MHFSLIPLALFATSTIALPKSGNEMRNNVVSRGIIPQCALHDRKIHFPHFRIFMSPNSQVARYHFLSRIHAVRASHAKLSRTRLLAPLLLLAYRAGHEGCANMRVRERKMGFWLKVRLVALTGYSDGGE